MFRPDQPFRKNTTYDGDQTHGPVNVLVIGSLGEDDDGNDLWRVRLPESGKAVIVFGDELSPQPDAPETILEAIEHLLTWRHPLCNAFVLEAIGRYADQTLADPDETRRQMAGGMIGAEAWLESASAVREMLERLKVN